VRVRFFPAVAGLPLAPLQSMTPLLVITKLSAIVMVVSAAQVNVDDNVQVPAASVPPMSVQPSDGGTAAALTGINKTKTSRQAQLIAR
jgi:hypothetical protein